MAIDYTLEYVRQRIQEHMVVSRQTCQEMIEEKERDGIVLTSAEERELTIKVGEQIELRKRDFAIMLFLARTVHRAFPELVQRKSFPVEFAYELKDQLRQWEADGGFDEDNIYHRLFSCFWLLPQPEFDEWVRLYATNSLVGDLAWRLVRK